MTTLVFSDSIRSRPSRTLAALVGATLSGVRRTVRRRPFETALHALDDRTLADIGLSRDLLVGSALWTGEDARSTPR